MTSLEKLTRSRSPHDSVWCENGDGSPYLDDVFRVGSGGATSRTGCVVSGGLSSAAKPGDVLPSVSPPPLSASDLLEHDKAERSRVLSHPGIREGNFAALKHAPADSVLSGEDAKSPLHGYVLSFCPIPIPHEEWSGRCASSSWDGDEGEIVRFLVQGILEAGYVAYVLCQRKYVDFLKEQINRFLEGVDVERVCVVPLEQEAPIWVRDKCFFISSSAENVRTMMVPGCVEEGSVPALIHYMHEQHCMRERAVCGNAEEKKASVELLDGVTNLTVPVGIANTTPEFLSETYAIASSLMKCGLVHQTRMMYGYYEGGNVLMYEPYVFVGRDNVEATRFVLQQEGSLEHVSEEDVLCVIAHDFGVSPECVIPVEQAEYHLDLMMCFQHGADLPEGKPTILLNSPFLSWQMQQKHTRNDFLENTSKSFGVARETLDGLFFQCERNIDMSGIECLMLSDDKKHQSLIKTCCAFLKTEKRCNEKDHAKEEIAYSVKEDLERRGFRVKYVALEDISEVNSANMCVLPSMDGVVAPTVIRPGYSTSSRSTDIARRGLFSGTDSKHVFLPIDVVRSFSESHGGIHCRTLPIKRL